MRRWTFLGVLVVALLACGTPSAIQPTATPEPTPIAMILPTEAPVPTDAPSPEATIAPAPTDEPEPTDAPAAALAPALGAAPKGSDCPADHPVKGNIRDRNPNKGEKIYHTPESPSYKDTKPERCFVDAAEAEAAGFRAPK